MYVIPTYGGKVRISDRYKKKLAQLRRKYANVGYYLALRDNGSTVAFIGYGREVYSFKVLKTK